MGRRDYGYKECAVCGRRFKVDAYNHQRHKLCGRAKCKLEWERPRKLLDTMRRYRAAPAEMNARTTRSRRKARQAKDLAVEKEEEEEKEREEHARQEAESAKRELKAAGDASYAAQLEHIGLLVLSRGAKEAEELEAYRFHLREIGARWSMAPPSGSGPPRGATEAGAVISQGVSAVPGGSLSTLAFSATS